MNIQNICGNCNFAQTRKELPNQILCFRYPPQAIAVQSQIAGAPGGVMFVRPQLEVDMPGCGEYLGNVKIESK